MQLEYKMIRILPMDRDDEFYDMEIGEVQSEFFLDELPKRNDEHGTGKYHYKKKGLILEEELTLVLFQYDNKIIASANLVNVIKFKEPYGIYNGALYFEPNSIRTFDPISNQKINDIFHDSVKFGQIKHKLNSLHVKDFFAKITNIKKVWTASSTTSTRRPIFSPAAKILLTTNVNSRKDIIEITRKNRWWNFTNTKPNHG